MRKASRPARKQMTSAVVGVVQLAHRVYMGAGVHRLAFLLCGHWTGTEAGGVAPEHCRSERLSRFRAPTNPRGHVLKPIRRGSRSTLRKGRRNDATPFPQPLRPP